MLRLAAIISLLMAAPLFAAAESPAIDFAVELVGGGIEVHALGKPWLFKQSAQALRGETPMPDPSMAEQKQLLLKHHGKIVERFGEERGNMLMRKYSCCYAQGVRGAREFRAHASRCSTSAEFIRIVNTLFPSDVLIGQAEGHPAAAQN